jgi:dipeptidyl-peptidase-4
VVAGEPELYGSLVRPTRFDPRRKYPVIVFTYGGPGVQSVKHGRPGYFLDQWLADQGFLVVSTDGRGTPWRGRAFERAVRGDLGALALEDQVRGLQGLARRWRGMDLRRVGIFGWSFGGYLAALAVMRRPDVFRAAAAGAPVVDWRDYDTHYTERYLGLPGDSPEAYDRSSLLTYAAALRRPLLLLHGTADDNCCFAGSLRLSDALLRARIEHEFVPLGGQTHLPADSGLVCAMYQRMLDFFQRCLAP